MEVKFTLGEVILAGTVVANLAVTCFMVWNLNKVIFGNGRKGLKERFEDLERFCKFTHRKSFETPDPDKGT